MLQSKLTAQQWIALGLLLAVFLIIIFIAIIPLISIGLNYHEQKNELVFRLQRSKQIVARKDHVVENITTIKQQYQQQNYFSARDTVALASADVQRFVKSIIARAGGQLTSTQVLPSSQNNGISRITVKVRMSGTVEVLRSILHDVETASPVMIVDQIDIRPMRGRRNRKTRKLEPSNKLNINFQATGFMRLKTL